MNTEFTKLIPTKLTILDLRFKSKQKAILKFQVFKYEQKQCFYEPP